MALRRPFGLDPPPRPEWRSGLSTAQLGPMAEDLLAVAFAAGASGRATIARPLADLGIDLYLRRRRTLLTVPVQVKSFNQLTQDGIASLELPIDAVSDHPNGYLAVVHLPAPFTQLYGTVFLIPFAEFRKRSPRALSHGKEVFQFVGNFADPGDDHWLEYAIAVDGLGSWFDAIPGWSNIVLPVGRELGEVLIAHGESPWRGDLGRLWVAGEIERAARAGALVIAEDRPRLDTVTLLVHDLRKQQIAGVHVRTQKITPANTVHFEVSRSTFFVDEKLYVLVVLLTDDERPHEFCLLIPSTDIPHLGYSETITFRHLTKRFAPYVVPSEQVGAVLLDKVFGS